MQKTTKPPKYKTTIPQKYYNAKAKNINAIYNYNLNLDELERLTFLDISKNCLVINNNKIKDTDSICNIQR